MRGLGVVVVSDLERAAWRLQSQADEWADALSGEAPDATAGDRVWEQELIRTAFADAARLTDQPKGW